MQKYGRVRLRAEAPRSDTLYETVSLATFDLPRVTVHPGGVGGGIGDGGDSGGKRYRVAVVVVGMVKMVVAGTCCGVGGDVFMVVVVVKYWLWCCHRRLLDRVCRLPSM